MRACRLVVSPVDGAHIYDDDPAKRAQNRASAYRWIEVAQRLGAAQIRIDCGGTEDMPDAMFDIIVDGYHDLLKHTDAVGLELLIENHWGPSRHAHNLVKLFEAVPRVGLLFDTNNFPPDVREAAWATCAKYTKSVHIKTFEFDEHGNDPTMDFPKVIRLLAETGYQGAWGIESVPRDGDEYGAIVKTKALITRVLSAEDEVLSAE